MSTSAPLRIGVFGLGTVGSGVVRILRDAKDMIERRCGRPIEVRRIVVRDPSREREVAVDPDLISDDPAGIFEDPEIDVGVEVVGGVETPRSLVQGLLEAGKDVVTANKALLCAHAPGIFREARERGRVVGFEAAVAGGIPIISAMGQALTANRIDAIEGILNGTCNFILNRMEAEGSSYADALAEAQRLGYAEADPTMDVDGSDAAQKLALLAALAFDRPVAFEDIPRQGIEDLDPEDLRHAESLGHVVRLVALAARTQGRLRLAVRPCLVPRSRPLAQVEGPGNLVVVEGDAVGRAGFSGPGAGQMPTASAVVADLIDIATGRAAATFPHTIQGFLEDPAAGIALESPDDVENPYYIRFNVEDRPHAFADIAHILGRHEISLASIRQHVGVREHPDSVAVVVMTHPTRVGQLRAANAELDTLPILKGPRICLPILG